MADKSDTVNISNEEFLMGITALEEELTLIPAAVLHSPPVRKYSRLKYNAKAALPYSSAETTTTTTAAFEKKEIKRCHKRVESGEGSEGQQINPKVSSNKKGALVREGHQLPQQTQVFRTLKDISNGNMNLTDQKIIKPANENNAVTGDTSNHTDQLRNKMKKSSRGRGRGGLTRGQTRGRGGVKRKVDENACSVMLGVQLPEPALGSRESGQHKRKDWTEDSRFKLHNDNHGGARSTSQGHKQQKTKEASDIPQDIPITELRSIRREHVEKDSNASVIQPNKRVSKYRQITSNSSKKQESHIMDVIDLTADVSRTIEETLEKCSKETLGRSEAAGQGKQETGGSVMEVKRPRGRPRKIPEPLRNASGAVVENKQSRREDANVTGVKRPRGRPKKNAENKQPTEEEEDGKVVKKPRGRPKKNVGSKQPTEKEEDAQVFKRPQGRPRKSVNPSVNQDQTLGESGLNGSRLTATRGRPRKNVKAVTGMAVSPGNSSRKAEKVKKSQGRPRKNVDALTRMIESPGKVGKVGKVKNARGRSKRHVETQNSIIDISDSSMEAGETGRGNVTLRRSIRLNETITNMSINVQLRRSTRERKTHYKFGEDSFYKLDQSMSWLDARLAEKKQGKNKVVKDTASAGGGGDGSSREAKTSCSTQKKQQKHHSKKLSDTENHKYNDNKLKKKVSVELKSITDQVSSQKTNQEESHKQNSTSGRNNTKTQHTKEKVNNNNNNNKVTQQTKNNKKKKEKGPSKTTQKAQDIKITAKKGTLKYLQQREKYHEALAREVVVKDDFHDNPLFAKKKFKFTKLLPSSLDDTFNIMTPKRDKNERPQDTAITPRVALLGQLQPITPTTQPYSPFPTLDTATKKDACREVYHMLQGQKRQTQRAKKALQNTMNNTNESTLKVPFTQLELPVHQDNTNREDCDTSRDDEYFSDS